MNQNSYNQSPYGNGYGGYGAPYPPQPRRNTPLIIALIILGIALLALAVLGGVMLGRNSSNEANGQRNSSDSSYAAENTESSRPTSSTTVEPSTITRTQTAIQPAPSTGADIPKTRTQTPTQNEQPSGPPSPPYAAGAGYEWFLKGPFQSTWTCTQNADSWPSGTSECFDYNGGAYYWAMRQASR